MNLVTSPQRSSSVVMGDKCGHTARDWRAAQTVRRKLCESTRIPVIEEIIDGDK